MELSKKEKIKIVEDAGIQFIDSNDVNLDELYRFAVTLDLIKQRLDGQLECFGSYDQNDPVCSKCFLGINGLCGKFKAYKEFCKSCESRDDVIKISIDKKGETFKMIDIETYMQRIKLRPASDSYKIAKAILEADNLSYGQVLDKVWDICGREAKISYVKTRFYQIRKIIEERTDLRIGILTKKYIHISKDLTKTC